MALPSLSRSVARLVLGALLLLVGALPLLAHSVHLSNCTLRADGAGNIVGTFSVFRDDFLRAMRHDIPELPSLSGLALRSAAIAQVSRYLALGAGGRPVPFVVDSTGADGTVYLFRFRAQMPTATAWSFSSRILFREYTDQMNLLRFEQGENARSYVLTPSRPSVDLPVE